MAIQTLSEIGYREPSQYGEFMSPEVTPPEEWLILDGHIGTEYIPLYVIGRLSDETMDRLRDPSGELDFDDIPPDDREEISQWYSPDAIECASIRTKCGARLSASGYMDSTDWILCDTEAEAEKELREQFPDAFLCNVYRLTFYAHCGMTTIREYFDERKDARARTAAILRLMRKIGMTILTLETGEQWESIEPEDSAMVPDTAGILRLETMEAYPEG